MCIDADNSGKGEPPGARGPEAASHAASTGSMLRRMTLGIPDSSIAAIILVNMLMRWGRVPGP